MTRSTKDIGALDLAALELANSLHSMTAPPSRSVFIDSCAVNRFAGINLDPVKALAGSSYQLAVTPDLAAEYRCALAHRLVEPHIKALLRRLVDHASPHAAPGGAPSRGADADLVILSRTSIVVTLDMKPPWDRAVGNPGLVLWLGIETAVKAGMTFRAILDAVRFDEAGHP